MSIDLTFIGQIVVFLTMLGLLWKVLYAPLNNAMEARTAKIEAGLAAADAAKDEKAKAEAEINNLLKDARVRAQEIVAAADRRAAEVQEESVNKARTDAQQIVDSAREEVEAEVARARQALRGEVADIALLAAERVIESELDAKRHADLVDRVISEGFGRA